MNLKHIINPVLLSGIVLASAALRAGTTFTDDFNSGSLGSYKSNVSGGGTGNWTISGGVLKYARTNESTADATLTWENVSLDFASANPYTISATIRFDAKVTGMGGAFSGLVFNHAGDSQTYYALRLAGNQTDGKGLLQLVKVVGGSLSLLSGTSGGISTQIDFEEDVALILKNVNASTYDISVVASSNPSTVLYSTTFTNAETGSNLLASGYAGIYACNYAGVGNFSISPVPAAAIPEAASAGCVSGLLLLGLSVWRRMRVGK
jgi:hypothetical protein